MNALQTDRVRMERMAGNLFISENKLQSIDWIKLKNQILNIQYGWGGLKEKLGPREDENDKYVSFI